MGARKKRIAQQGHSRVGNQNKPLPVNEIPSISTSPVYPLTHGLRVSGPTKAGASAINNRAPTAPGTHTGTASELPVGRVPSLVVDGVTVPPGMNVTSKPFRRRFRKEPESHWRVGMIKRADRYVEYTNQCNPVKLCGTDYPILKPGLIELPDYDKSLLHDKGRPVTILKYVPQKDYCFAIVAPHFTHGHEGLEGRDADYKLQFANVRNEDQPNQPLADSKRDDKHTLLVKTGPLGSWRTDDRAAIRYGRPWIIPCDSRFKHLGELDNASKSLLSNMAKMWLISDPSSIISGPIAYLVSFDGIVQSEISSRERLPHPIPTSKLQRFDKPANEVRLSKCDFVEADRALRDVKFQVPPPTKEALGEAARELDSKKAAATQAKSQQAIIMGAQEAKADECSIIAPNTGEKRGRQETNPISNEHVAKRQKRDDNTRVEVSISTDKEKRALREIIAAARCKEQRAIKEQEEQRQRRITAEKALLALESSDTALESHDWSNSKEHKEHTASSADPSCVVLKSAEQQSAHEHIASTKDESGGKVAQTQTIEDQGTADNDSTTTEDLQSPISPSSSLSPSATTPCTDFSDTEPAHDKGSGADQVSDTILAQPSDKTTCLFQ